MKVYKSLNDIPVINSCIALAIGMFDGIHRGHRKIINSLIEFQKENSHYQTMVITFSNHPLEVLEVNSKIRYLASNNYKVNYFKNVDIDYLAIMPFTKEFSEISHIKFIDFIINRFDKICMFIGSDFKFGKDNRGNIDFLKEKMKLNKNLYVKVIERINYKGQEISSNIIRKMISSGELEKSAKLLSRDYFIEGVCVKGNQLGKKINFPTINIINKKMVSVLDGVYKSFIEINNNKHLAMSYVNKKKYNKPEEIIETHVFNFDQLVYGEEIKVIFKNKIREILKFESLTDLKNQLTIDKIKVMSLN